MPLKRGAKTATCGAVATTSLATAFIDPTGISLLTFLGSSAGVAIGTTYHTVRGMVKHTTKAMEENRRRKAEKQALAMGMTLEQHMLFQCKVEHTIQQISASIEGSAVQGILFLGLPYMGFIWAINTYEATVYLGRLKGLADEAGGKRALARNISKRNAVWQVMAGTAIKTLTICLTLGHDFDVAMSEIGTRFDDADYKSLAESAGEAHESFLETPVIHHTTELVDYPQDAMKEFLAGMEDVSGEGNGDWTWTEDHSPGGVAALGVVVAAVSKGIDYAVDENLHKGAAVVGGTRQKT